MNSANAALWTQFEGQTIENTYRLTRLIGVGGFAGVFEADHCVEGRILRRVAIKLVLSDTEFIQRQLDELTAATMLHHPNLLGCFHAGSTVLARSRMLYLVMELAGDTLQVRLAQGVSLAELVAVTTQMTAALAYLHQKRLVHRDLKPANVLYVDGAWKLSDFGTVRQSLSTATDHTRGVIGTVAYMPPESFEGIVSPAWDTWSLGVLVLEALTGNRPFAETSEHALIAAIMQKTPSIPSGLPEPFDQIVGRCLVRNHRERWNAAQIADMLRKWIAAKVRDLIADAQRRRAQGGYAEALKFLRGALQLDPVSTEAQLLLDDIQREQDETVPVLATVPPQPGRGDRPKIDTVDSQPHVTPALNSPQVRVTEAESFVPAQPAAHRKQRSKRALLFAVCIIVITAVCAIVWRERKPAVRTDAPVPTASRNAPSTSTPAAAPRLPAPPELPSFDANTVFTRVPPQPSENAMLEEIDDFQFSKDGRFLWVAGRERYMSGLPKIQIWDTNDFTLSREIPGWARHLALSADGKFFAHDWFNITARQYPDITVPGASPQSQILVRNVSNGEAVREFRSPEKEYEAFAFHPNSVWIAVGDTACCALPNYSAVWDISTGRRLYEIKGLENSDMFLRFSPDGSVLATASHDVSVWKAADGTKIKNLEPSGDITDLQFSPDGQYLVAAHNRSGKIRRWRTSDWTEAAALPGEGYYDLPRIAFSPDSRILVSTDHPSGTRIWYLSENKLIQTIKAKDAFHSNRVAFDPLGRFFVMTQYSKTPYLAVWAPAKR